MVPLSWQWLNEKQFQHEGKAKVEGQLENFTGEGISSVAQALRVTCEIALRLVSSSKRAIIKS